MLGLLILIAIFVFISILLKPSTSLPTSIASAVDDKTISLPLITKDRVKPTETLPQPIDTPTQTPISTATIPPPESTITILEDFEGQSENWKVDKDVSNGGAIEQDTQHVHNGKHSAKLNTSAANASANLRLNFFDSAADHQWNERPGTWHWQQTYLYVPATTIDQLNSNEYITIGGLWSNQSNYGWWLRVRQNGELYVVGHRDSDGQPIEFKVYGQLPVDQWVSLELGLHTQNGPGVKRAFAFLIDGSFYGWYHQGKLGNETYDRAAVGILETNANAPLVVYIDDWATPDNSKFPTGPDLRSTNTLQEQDYRLSSGIQWQIDWTSWENRLQLHPTYGLFAGITRLQSGRNLDRMPELKEGWAEIEVDWPNGVPSLNPSQYFGPMVGFRKEINREENLEIIPIGQGNGNVDLTLEAWVNGGPVILANWPMPLASIGGTHIPEPGDIIRVRWQQSSASQLNVKASYYDASAVQWHTNVIDLTVNINNINGVNFTDGYHLASSITIDTVEYAIRRFKVGTLDTYPSP